MGVAGRRWLVAVAAIAAAFGCAERAPGPAAAPTDSAVADAGAGFDAELGPASLDGAVPPSDADRADGPSAATDVGGGDVPTDLATAPTATVVWVVHPKAAGIALRGSAAPLSWQIDLAASALTSQGARFDLPGQGTWQVKPLHTGAWSIGANYVVQGGVARTIHPYFDPKLAAARRDDFSLAGPDGKPRTVRVRLPAGYDENSLADYPLLVMFDGQNVFDAATATFGVAWEVDEAVDKSLAGGKLSEVVVAAVDHAGAERIFEYTPWPDSKGQGGGGAATMVWLNGAVLPALHARYRLQAGPHGHAIGGSSLGGLMSLYAVGAHPAHWRRAICMSGSWWWAGQKALSWFANSPGAAVKPRVWIDAGTANDGLAETQALRKVLIGLGWIEGADFGYLEASGANHSEAAWAARVHLALQFLFDPGDRAPAFP